MVLQIQIQISNLVSSIKHLLLPHSSPIPTSPIPTLQILRVQMIGIVCNLLAILWKCFRGIFGPIHSCRQALMECFSVQRYLIIDRIVAQRWLDTWATSLNGRGSTGLRGRARWLGFKAPGVFCKAEDQDSAWVEFFFSVDRITLWF